MRIDRRFVSHSMKLLFLPFLLSASFTCAQSVTRGPYLQFPTDQSMIVRWRTDVPTQSRVHYNTSIAGLASQYTGTPALVTDHSVTLNFLQPLTEYFFGVSDGINIISGEDSTHRFTTWPTPGGTEPVRAWVIGDFGKGNAEQMQVKQSFIDEFGDDMPNFWIWLGDNAYESGSDQEFQDKVFGTNSNYHPMFTRMPFLPCPGNHDYLSVMSPALTINPPDQDGPYFDIVDVPTNGEMGGVPSGYELYYSYDYGNVHFLSLNSEIGSIFSGSDDWIGSSPFNSFSSSPFTQWLHNDLQANDKPWVVAYFHQPPHTDGSHDSDAFWEIYMEAMRENICPILENYGVDVVYSGHSHVYERSYLINGFFGEPSDFNSATHIVDGSSGKLSDGTPYVKYVDGPDEGVGTVYVVQGNSASKDDDASLNHPAHYFGHGCGTCVGSSVFEVNGDTLTGRYLAATGEFLDDFTIIKSSVVTVGDETKYVQPEIKIAPNPFSDQTSISWELNNVMEGELLVTALDGRIVATLFHGDFIKTGSIQVSANELGLANGVYLISIKTADREVVKRIMRIAE
ncbi:MAG: hypothetical protein ACI85F_000328 [Bacteroidia bacterium]|jgi:hypothetical protein